MTENQITRSFIKMGIVFTIIASIIYPIYYYIQLPERLELIFVLIFAFSIAISSVGIFYFLKLNTIRPCLILGLGFSMLAALTFAIAESVRIALQWPLENILIQGDQSFTYGISSRVYMGIGFIWKFLFSLGLIFLAIPAFNHPKLGKILPLFGIILGLSIIVINIISFPESPEEFGMICLGPSLPIWHLLVAIFIILSPSWIIEKSTE